MKSQNSGASTNSVPSAQNEYTESRYNKILTKLHATRPSSLPLHSHTHDYNISLRICWYRKRKESNFDKPVHWNIKTLSINVTGMRTDENVEHRNNQVLTSLFLDIRRQCQLRPQIGKHIHKEHRHDQMLTSLCCTLKDNANKCQTLENSCTMNVETIKCIDCVYTCG